MQRQVLTQPRGDENHQIVSEGLRRKAACTLDDSRAGTWLVSLDLRLQGPRGQSQPMCREEPRCWHRPPALARDVAEESTWWPSPARGERAPVSAAGVWADPARVTEELHKLSSYTRENFPPCCSATVLQELLVLPFRRLTSPLVCQPKHVLPITWGLT